MSKALKFLFAANLVLLLWYLLTSSGAIAIPGYAQRPPDFTVDGVPYLMVNVNPTDVPPMVNINPYGRVPRVEIDRFPAPPSTGCENGRNFFTDVAPSISGPMVVTYVNVPADTSVTLSGGAENGRSVSFASAAHLATAIYLASGQTLDFGDAVLYSGCRPE